MKKALVIGIDGVPYELLNMLIERGCMEGLKAILNPGYILHRMKASCLIYPVCPGHLL